ncbi:hypothetical protein AJ80_08916 [Polytolypa hystricis UAMH7299]|uniref:Zn(2)-C6 fungal-type domain-containing protein n=1 Tax=Polytolypa hystricis (strain UAMH7299) TaxID=1447883 RepID=A0A2B7WZW6_POLH7|nr:hypothetical protein AJ80_08916 [Polytolypa hystricis UAMH7299]
MYASPAPSQSPTKSLGIGTRKLRLSCDNCFAAKVKCSKNRPTCDRCSNTGVVCHYSVSRRAGKPKGSSQRTKCRSSESSTSSSSGPGSEVLSEGSGVDFTNLDEVDIDALCRSVLTEHPFLLPQSADSNLSSGVCSSGAKFQTKFLGGCHSPADDALSRIQSTSAPLPNFTFFPTSTPSPSSGGTPLGMLTGHSSMTRGISSSGNSEDFFSTITPADLQYLNQSLSSFDGQTSDSGHMPCNCAEVLLEIVGIVQNSGTAASFDQVLVLNKYAVRQFMTFISCPHPMDISCMLFVTAVLGKLVNTYRRSIEKSGNNETALTLGQYPIDHDDEQRIMLVLVKSEMEKVDMLLQLVEERFENVIGPDDKAVYEANISFLRRRVRETMDAI